MSRSMIPWGALGGVAWNDFDREMRDLRERFFGPEPHGEPEAFAPTMNVAETDKSYEVTFDVPGVDPKDLTVEVHDGLLTVGGERKSEKEEKGKRFHRIEKRYGAFRRVVPLDVPVDRESVEATYRDGVLKVMLAKTATALPKKVAVKA